MLHENRKRGRLQMKHWLTVLFAICMLVTATTALAQTPLAASTEKAIDATAGNRVLQLRYYDHSPVSQLSGNLDYGLLLTENREFVLSGALMFDMDLVPVPRLHLQIGPQANLAWLATGTKTNVFALAVGAGARYELIE